MDDGGGDGDGRDGSETAAMVTAARAAVVVTRATAGVWASRPEVVSVAARVKAARAAAVRAVARTEWATVAAVMAAAAAVMAAAAVAVATRRPRHGENRNAPSRLPSAWSEAEGIGQRQGNQHWVH
jgi:predicted membrane-bound mannosyltransferase